MRALLLLTLSLVLTAQPVKLIFDTDMGNDIDDAMALSVIHALQSRGECQLLAVTISKDNPWAGRFTDAVNTFYGRPDIPIGVVRNGMAKDDGKYNRQVLEQWLNGRPAYAYDFDPATASEAVQLMRRTLAAQPDGSVALVMVGFSTNVIRLLDSKADAVSPLNGVELVKKKVKVLSTMAATFAAPWMGTKAEYNVQVDVPAAKRLFREWPVDLVVSGWELGHWVQIQGQSMREDYRWVGLHPVKDAYRFYRDGLTKSAAAFDLTSVLWAVRPERGYFGLSPKGQVVINDDGTNSWRPDPTAHSQYLTMTPEQIAVVRETLTLLSSQPR
jgi:purine nucleosidase